MKILYLNLLVFSLFVGLSGCAAIKRTTSRGIKDTANTAESGIDAVAQVITKIIHLPFQLGQSNDLKVSFLMGNSVSLPISPQTEEWKLSLSFQSVEMGYINHVVLTHARYKQSGSLLKCNDPLTCGVTEQVSEPETPPLLKQKSNKKGGKSSTKPDENPINHNTSCADDWQIRRLMAWLNNLGYESRYATCQTICDKDIECVTVAILFDNGAVVTLEKSSDLPADMTERQKRHDLLRSAGIEFLPIYEDNLNDAVKDSYYSDWLRERV